MLKLNTVRTKMAVVAAISGLSLMGCGGGGTANVSSVGLSSSITPTRVTNSTAITATGTPSTHTFGTTSAVLPANIAAPTGEVTIVTTDTRLANFTGSTGEVLINGNATGLSVTDGYLSGNLALPTDGGPYTIQIGSNVRSRTYRPPFILSDGTHELWINNYLLITIPKFVTGGSARGYLAIPNYSGRMPSNGTSLRGASLTADAAEISGAIAMSVTGYTTDLTVAWTSNGQTVSFHQQRTFDSNNKAVFSGLTDAMIPADGVDSVTLSMSSSNG